MEDLKTMDGIPIMQAYREITFNDESLYEKIQYLIKVKKEGNLGGIINRALKEYLEPIFIKEGIEHYSDPSFEASHRAIKARLAREAKEREDQRLLEIAKQRLIEKEVERLRAEEKRTGKRIEEATNIKVEILRVTQYEGRTLNQGEQIFVSPSVADRWSSYNIAKIVSKEQK